MPKRSRAELCREYLLSRGKFRLYGDPPNGQYQPIRVRQIVGGARWSLAFVRVGETRRDGGAPTRPGAPVEEHAHYPGGAYEYTHTHAFAKDGHRHDYFRQLCTLPECAEFPAHDVHEL